MRLKWKKNDKTGKKARGIDELADSMDRVIGICLSLQAENARLKAEVESLRSSQQSVLKHEIIPLIPPALDVIKTMMQSRPDINLASVMTVTTECLKILKDMKTLIESQKGE